MRTPFALAVWSLALFVGGPAVRADDYLGADAILKQVDAARGSTPKAGLVHQWHQDLKDYREHAAGLPPEQAARDWLALFDRAVKLPELPDQNGDGSNIPPRLRPVFDVLPPPVDWDALAAQIAARPLPPQGTASRAAFVLRTIAGMLQGNRDAVRQAIDALQKQDDEQSQNGGQNGADAGRLHDAFLTLTRDKHSALADFEGKLALLKSDSGASANEAEREHLHLNTLVVPDLVALAGAPRAEVLLRQVFTLDVPGVDISGDKTKALARQVAVEVGDQLKFVPWYLVDTLDSIPLYEFLSKRFPDTGSDRLLRATADGVYLLYLISRGCSDEATALVLRLNRTTTSSGSDVLSYLSEEALGDMAAEGYAKEVYRLFDHLLTVHPDLPYWNRLTEAAVLAGETDAMLGKIKAASERPGLAVGARTALRKSYGDALLAADHVTEALPVLRELAAAKVNAVTTASEETNGPLGDAIPSLVALANIGSLLNDDALVNEQLDALNKAEAAHPDNTGSVTLPEDNILNEIFVAAKRGPEMERLLSTGLRQGQRHAETDFAHPMEADLVTTSGAIDPVDYQFQATQLALYALVDLYSRVGRYQDIVTLLDHSASWGAEDVKTLLDSNRFSSGPTFGTQVARALQKTGHADDALRVVNACLERDGGHDPAYALLLELLPPDQAEARLNALFQGDQFEERPLIWRAVLQLGQGRLDEAEKSARQAIGIDPSDGEEGRGDRMRAYAVLGDVLERKGDKEKAAQMRQAVQAIRLSEDADQFHAAGLLTRAVGMYEKALGYFADAYCIQSRLAIQLTALGKLDEAASHYERAYELMPESFGRMESHCFGCEGAFKGARAQATAERVFQQLVARQPDNPRVHYLLGYLRGEQERRAEAAREYREAVRLDPDYINAWKQLAATTDDPADRDRAELNLLRLDPRQRHDGADVSSVSDLRALWTAVEAAEKFALPKTPSLYPLAASKTLLEQWRQRHPQKPSDDEDSVKAPDPSSARLTPRSAILKNEIVSQALQLLRRNDDESPITTTY